MIKYNQNEFGNSGIQMKPEKNFNYLCSVIIIERVADDRRSLPENKQRIKTQKYLVRKKKIKRSPNCDVMAMILVYGNKC